MGVSRRSFLKGSAATAAATMVSGSVVDAIAKTSADITLGPGNKWPGRVAINFNKSAFGTSAEGNPVLDTTVAAKMVDESIMLLTGETTVAAAWKAVFPATLTASSTIAIKVPLGCASQKMAPHFSTVKAIVDGLTQMDFGGSKLPAANITIYEMECSNNFSSYGYTAANLPGVKIVRDSRVTSPTDGAVSAEGKMYAYAKSLQSNFLINVFRPGGHGTSWSGFTLGFKNHYGTYPPQPEGHSSKAQNYLRDINCTGVVFNKNVLSVCVGLYGAEEASGQPGSADIGYTEYTKTMDSASSPRNPSTIIMSTDPVSIEMQAIKMMRLNNGKKYTTADLPNYLKASGGVAGALSDKVYNIGVIEESAMDIRKMVNSVKVSESTIAGKAAPKTPRAGHVSVKSLQHHGSTFIEYSVPHSIIGSDAVIEIYDLKGTKIFTGTQKIQGVRSNYSWNERSQNGQVAPRGMYIVTITAYSMKLSEKFTLMS